MEDAQANKANHKKHIFISSNRYELPFVRRIQILLESKYGYTTYIHERVEFENSEHEAVELNALLDLLSQEMRTHREILVVVSSQWRRSALQEGLKRLATKGTDPFGHFSAKHYLDIDDCWSYSGDELQNYLANALDLALAGELSPRWNMPPQTPSQLPSRDRMVWDYALDLFKDFSEPLALEALHKTQGEVIGLIFALEGYQVATFSNSKPSSMSIPEAITGKLIETFIWHGKYRTTYNQSYKRNTLTEIVLKKFHMYPPHIPRGSVFISHSTKNLPVVRHLQLVAEEAGYRTFAFRLGMFEGRQLSTINDVPQVIEVLAIIEKEIAACDFMLLADSPEVNLTPWTFAEKAIASIYNKSVYLLDVSNLNELDFSTQNIELKKRFSAFQADPEEVLQVIDLSIEELKYIMLAQSWIEALPFHSNEQIADMIKSVSFDRRERSLANNVFSELCFDRCHTPRLPNINSLVLDIDMGFSTFSEPSE